MFHRTHIGPIGLLAVVLVLAAAPLSATTVDYDNFTDWASATGSYELVDFDEALPPAGWEIFPDANGYTSPSGEVQFVGFTAPTNYLLYRAEGIIKGGYYDANFDTTVQVNLPADVTSFSVELMALYGSPATFTVMLSNGDSFPLTGFADQSPQFFGITTDVPISQVNFIMTSGVPNTTQPGLDSFYYGIAGGGELPPEDPAETPETATFLLVGSGLFWLCRQHRRRGLSPA